MEQSETFGVWMRRRRRFLGLTQDELADCAGCSPITIRKMESDERRPSRQLAELLADCLQIDPQEREAFVQFARQAATAGVPSLPALSQGFAREPGDILPFLPAPSHNLPVPLTSFIGRDSVLAELMEAVRDARARPLTLTGAGGSGKTRLALEIAIDAGTELADVLPDGAWWVDLAPVEDGTLVAAAINRALGLVETADQPSEDTLAAYLATRRLLLVLDNCEHLVATCARLTERLLRRCPDIQVLATSREPLGVSGEVIYPVPTLSLPDPAAGPEELMASEAVRLFMDRATAQRPGFLLTADNAAAVAQICRRLDGIPLALELAAARVRVLSPGQIAARLDNRFALLTGGARTALPRQQTLRALVDWSYELLDPADRVLFRRLAVFVDSWTLEAAEAVCAGQVEGVATATGDTAYLAAEDILELLSRLVDKSLVRAYEAEEQMRYEMLETISAYAREKLSESGEMDGIQVRHLAYYVAWAEAAATEILGHRGAVYLEWTGREYGNLRAALRRSLDQPADPATGIRLATALGQFWLRRNYPQEGGRWTERALALMPVETSPALQGRLFSAAGTMAWLRSDIDLASVYHERALFIFRAQNDLAGVAESLCNLSVMETMRGRMERALEWTEESARLARESGNRWVLGFTLLNLGLAYFHVDRPVPADRTLVECADVLREAGDGLTLALTLCALVIVSTRLEEIEMARAYMAEALQLAAEVGDVRLEATAWQSWGKVQRHIGEPPAGSFRHSIRLFARTADRLNILESLDEYAVCLAGSHPERAARLLASSEIWRARLGLERPDNVTGVVAGAWPALRAALGEDGFESACRRGGEMSLEEAVALALREPDTGAR